MTELIVTETNTLKFIDERGNTWSVPGRRDPQANNIILETDGEIARKVQDHLNANLGFTIQTWTAEERALNLLSWKSTVTQFADGLADQITGPVPESEKLSWDRKYDAARAYTAEYASSNSHASASAAANTAEPAGWTVLQTEESLTNEGMHTLSTRVIQQAMWYAAAAGAIAGVRRNTLGALDTMNITNPNWTNADAEGIINAAKAAALTQFQNIMAQNPGK